MYTDREQWKDIRHRVLVKHESKRSVQLLYNIHWDTLQKILEHPEPPGHRQSKPRRKRKLEKYLPIIEEILEADNDASRM